MPENGRGRALYGSSLLPTKFEKDCIQDLSTASMWIIAGIPINVPQPGPEQPEEPRFRVFLTQTTPKLLLMELYSLQAFNMMDPDISGDVIFGMDAISNLMKQPKMLKDQPLAYVVQGAGPHFCPGGNPSPNSPPGHTVFTTTQYTGYMAFVRCRELALPGIAAMHGTVIGGGVAYSLNVCMRMATNATTFCFGNASRGAVPGMALSSNLHQTIGLPAAMSLYLTDSTFTAYGAMKAKYLSSIEVSTQSVKLKALQTARRVAASPGANMIPGIRPPLDMVRYSSEAHAINMSAKTGVLFANITVGPQTFANNNPQATEAEDRLANSKVVSAKAATTSRPQRKVSAGRPKRRVRREGAVH